MRTARRRPRKLSIPAVVVCFAALLLSRVPLHAAYSLDGSHCIIFDGAPKRDLAQCVRWTPKGHTLSVVLAGKAPNIVSKISISMDGKPPFQTLTITALPTISHADVGIRFQDMNFDGHIDLAVMRSADPRANRPYLYYLYRPKEMRFDRSAELEALTAPKFDVNSGRVSSQWTEGKTRSLDIFAWEEGELRLLERTIRNSETQTCKRLRFQWEDGMRTLASSSSC